MRIMSNLSHRLVRPSPQVSAVLNVLPGLSKECAERHRSSNLLFAHKFSVLWRFKLSINSNVQIDPAHFPAKFAAFMGHRSLFMF